MQGAPFKSTRCLSYTGSQPVRLHQGARFPEALLFRSVPWLVKKECICGCRLAVRTRMHSARHAVRRHHRPAQALGAPPMFHPLWQATLPFFSSVCTSVKWGIAPTPSQGYLGEMRRLHKQTLNKHSYDQAFTSLRPRFVILQRKVTITLSSRSGVWLPASSQSGLSRGPSTPTRGPCTLVWDARPSQKCLS